MNQLDAIAQQIRGNFWEVDSHPDFAGDRMWLTLYLAGKPKQLAGLSTALRELGWSSASGWNSGFIYPKLQVTRSADAAVAAIGAVVPLVIDYGAEILNADADTSDDVFRSSFVTLYETA